jgi:hypothetical protein
MAGKKPKLDISDLLGFLNQPKVKAATNLSQGTLTSSDVMGLTGGGQSKAAPYSAVLANAANQKLKNDYETAKFLADWYTPFSEGQRLVQGKSESMDPVWAAMSIFPFGKVGKKLKNIDKETKMMLDVLRSSKPLRNQVAGSNSGSGPYEGQYSPLDILLMSLAGE